MKKTVKRVVALMLVLVFTLSLVACKESQDEKTTTKPSSGTSAKEYTKPTSVKVMWDGTVLKESDEYTDALYAAYDEAYGLKIEWIRPDHSKYAEYVSQAFASNDLPDVLLLSAGQYAAFAARGFLYDMKSDWEASGIYDDGRFSDLSKAIINTYYVEGKNGELGLYGLPTTRGNGCCTFVRESWLTAIGKTVDDIKTYANYYDMLVAMKTTLNKDFVVTGAGYISNEAPYVNYLPEFYQSAYPDFMEKDGKWVDGFAQPEMKAALERLTSAYSAQLLDPQLNSNTTTNARNNFIDNKAGVFTYWAGTWMNTLANNIIAKDTDGKYPKGDIVALKPIAEIGKYIERQGAAVAILKDATNAAGIYKYFVEPIFQGTEVMSVWMYGAKGTQWDTKAETITLNKVEYKFSEGEFHFLLNKKGSAFLTKNNIDPLLPLCSYVEGKNPAPADLTKFVPEMAYKNQVMFNENCTPAPAIKSNAVLTMASGDIMAKRMEIATAIIEGKMSYEEGMKEYNTAVGSKVDLCLESLNE